ncbi:MAG: FHA domain-containing protein [Candidatus Promineifilaceae bacterium]
MFAILIYLILWRVLRTVQHEMLDKVQLMPARAAGYPGRLRVLTTGNDPHLHTGQIFRLTPDVTIGRDHTNTIQLHDPYASRKHTGLRWRGSTWTLENYNEQSGSTLINGEPLYESTTTLQIGDRLQIGTVQFELATP